MLKVQSSSVDNMWLALGWACVNLSFFYVVSGFKLPYTLQFPKNRGETWLFDELNAQDHETAMIVLENVKNIRDLSLKFPQMISGRIFRMGCISKASESDQMFLLNQSGINTLIDLRSPDEWKDDELLHGSIYEQFANYQFDPKIKSFVMKTPTFPSSKSSKLLTSSLSNQITTPEHPYKRYFVSLMSEHLIKKEIFKRMKFTDKMRAGILYLLSGIFPIANTKVREMFISMINHGGLYLLNELVVDLSGDQIVSILKLFADVDNGSIGFYCTAGKDRTGLIAMFLLTLLGASEEDILADYALSDNAYKELNNDQAVVASLQQNEVDKEIFLRAHPDVMKQTMKYIDTKYGSIRQYLSLHGFDDVWQQKLRENFQHISQ